MVYSQWGVVSNFVTNEAKQWKESSITAFKIALHFAADALHKLSALSA